MTPRNKTCGPLPPDIFFMTPSWSFMLMILPSVLFFWGSWTASFPFKTYLVSWCRNPITLLTTNVLGSFRFLCCFHCAITPLIRSRVGGIGEAQLVRAWSWICQGCRFNSHKGQVPISALQGAGLHDPQGAFQFYDSMKSVTNASGPQNLSWRASQISYQQNSLFEKEGLV